VRASAIKIVQALAFLGVAGAANAQQGVILGSGANSRVAEPRGAEAPTSAKLSKTDVARIVTVGLARCMLQRNRKAIVPALLAPRFAVDPGAKQPAMAASECLEDGTLTIPPNVLRAAYFTALYRDEFRTGMPVLPSVANGFHDGASEPFGDKQRQWIGLRQFADCVARRDLRSTHALIVAEAGSAAEPAAFKALAPHLGPCLPAGLSLKFTPAVLSGLLAEVVYRQGVAGQ
jgi:hypothetical protein